MAQVSLTHVSKVYEKKVRAVNDFNLSIGEGEFVVFVGPSGCGKSTTLRMIAGLEEITEGEVKIAGRIVNQFHPKDRDIAMVFQNYALYPHMSVYKNMAFGLMLRKMQREEIKKRVDIAAKMLGLEELLQRKPRQLSGGQRQRVALGRAIVREPKVFLFDEPLSNLDAKLRVTTRTEIKKLHQRLRTTTIYVTHDQEEAMTLGDRIVVMSAARGYGCIEQVDSPLNVYKRPANRFVGSFLGRTPMNFLPCTLVEDRGFVAVHEPDIRLRIPEVHAPKLRGHLNKPLTLGWRPSAMSDVRIGKFADGEGNTMTLKAVLVEPLGRNIDVTCVTKGGGGGGTEVLARVDAQDNFPVGKEVTFHIDMDHVHLFDAGPFGTNLLHPLIPQGTP